MTNDTIPSRRLAPLTLIDIGINLGHDSYDSDRDEVLARAEAAGLVQMVVTGASVEGSRKAIELARSQPGKLFATAGVHPHHATELTPDSLSILEELARQPEVVAAGECGLDYFRDFFARGRCSSEAFHRQLELATQVGKPVFLHQRDAHEDFVAILREHRQDAGRRRRPLLHRRRGRAAAPIWSWASLSASRGGSAMSAAAPICCR